MYNDKLLSCDLHNSKTYVDCWQQKVLSVRDPTEFNFRPMSTIHYVIS